MDEQENISTARTRLSKPMANNLIRAKTLQIDDPNSSIQLPSPPSSQVNLLDLDMRLEASRTLISPPPEPEELLSKFTRVSGREALPFTPSLLANSSTSKRKRPVASHSSTNSSTSSTATVASQVNATPNPKPRKQTRRHNRTSSTQSTSPDSLDQTVTANQTPTRSRPQLKRQGSPRNSINSQSPRTSPITTPTRSRIQPFSPSRSKQTLLQSPHAGNPDADYIPPLAASSFTRRSLRHSRRSATPIPPYEPPSDVFTPPREVMLSPPAHVTSSRNRGGGRKSTAKSKGKLKIVVSVKGEPPEIDLTRPAPPASPTDDPLLLSGPIEVPSSSRSNRSVQKDISRRTEESSPVKYRSTILCSEQQADQETRSSLLADLPASSPPPSSDDDADEGDFDWKLNHNQESTDMSMDLDNGADVLPVFNLDPAAAGGDSGWTDSDEDDHNVAVVREEDGLTRKGIEAGEGEGEYTGRWRLLKVPTKADPPSSATRQRMDEWGRPISPFPGRKRDSNGGVKGTGEEEEDDTPYEREQGSRLDHHQIVQEQVVEDDEIPETGCDDVQMQSANCVPDYQNNEARRQGPGEELCQSPTPLGAFDFGVLHDRLIGAEQIQPGADDFTERDFEPSRLIFSTSLQDDEIVRADSGAAEIPEVSYAHLHYHPPESDAAHFNFENHVDQVANHEVEEEEEVYREVSIPPEEVAGTAGVRTGLQADGESDMEHEWEDEERIDRELSSEPCGEDEDGHEHGHQRKSIIGDEEEDESRLVLTTAHHVVLDKHVSDVAEDDTHEVDEVYEGGSEDETSDVENPSVVKITSADPRAAARAAAILKLHDYDCFTKILVKQRRNSHSILESVTRNARRRGVSAAGVCKESGKRTPDKRRMTLGGMIGDRVYIPGSPAMTLPELLREAEVNVKGGCASEMATPLRETNVNLCDNMDSDPFKSPGFDKRVSEMSKSTEPGEREWTKDDWKQLDACFTEERLAVGEQVGLGEGVMAELDDVLLEDVVNRFTALLGGEEVVHMLGTSWTRENLLRRAQALLKKQRSGFIAPPIMPTLRTPSPFSRQSSIEVPDFTPLRPLRRADTVKSRPKPVLAFPSAKSGGPFSDLPPEHEKTRKVPASLLAPRYSHLLEEAIAVSKEGINTIQTAHEVNSEPSQPPGMNQYRPSHSQGDAGNNVDHQQSIGKRMKGFLFSYLPLSKSTIQQTKSRALDTRSGLPLPPPDLLDKARGPIETPVRPPQPKPPHPKELVHLNHAPLAEKGKRKKGLPKRIPRRMVELKNVDPPEEKPVVTIPFPRPRRSSGESVKDLVKSFEEMEKGTGRDRTVAEMGRRMGLGVRSQPVKPVWKP